MPYRNEYNISLDKEAAYYFDWSTFLITILLVTVGLLSIYSATYDAGMSSLFFKQLILACIGLLSVVVIMFFPFRWFRNMATPLYLLNNLLLVIVLFFGEKAGGTIGWLNIGGVRFQPAEFAKLSTLLMLAHYLSNKGTDIRTIRDLLTTVGIVLIPAALTAWQPDTGTASVYLALFLGVLFWTGFDLFILYFVISIPLVIVLSLMGKMQFFASTSLFALVAAMFRKKFLVTVSAIALIVMIGYLSPIIVNNLKPHQKDRIVTFINPGSDPRGKGYNVIQSILAVGSGGFAGKGFLQGTQTQLRYIPKQWTDFIYCVPTEEFGFLGGTLVIALLFGIIYRAVNIASITDNKFMSIVCFGIASIFFYHSVINIGMALGLTPVMGIPLPFLSYGGTSLILNLFSVGILMNTFRGYKTKSY